MEGKIERGDMFYAYLTDGVGSEQAGYRPVLIIQNNKGNEHSNTTIVAIVTSKTKSKTKIFTHCHIQAQQGLTCDSIVLLEQLRTIDKIRLHYFIGTLDDETIERVNHALAISIGLKETR
jgi:mRNA interferase MazF